MSLIHTPKTRRGSNLALTLLLTFAATCALQPAASLAVAAPQSAPNAMPDAMPDENSVPIPMASVTFSPILLVFPLMEITAEYRVSPMIGVALIGGFGKVKDTVSDTGVTIWELGAQANAYVLGDFRHGLHFGAEVIYIGASASSGKVEATASGLAAGGYVGYKWAASIGFTFVFQLGYQVAGIGATATDGTDTESRKESQKGPLANLNVGWSF